jgi:hypothetical protein
VARAHARPRRRRVHHLIVNERREAGASLPHTHAQLYALDFVPASVARERERFGAYATRTMGGNLLADLVQEEVRRRERIVAIDDEAVLMAPYGARLPYQLLLAPRTSRPRFEDEGPTGAALLHDALNRLRRRLGATPPLNLWVRTAPRGADHFAGASTSSAPDPRRRPRARDRACTSTSSPPSRRPPSCATPRWSSRCSPSALAIGRVGRGGVAVRARYGSSRPGGDRRVITALLWSSCSSSPFFTLAAWRSTPAWASACCSRTSSWASSRLCGTSPGRGCSAWTAASTGALISWRILANTGYLGIRRSAALLGGDALGAAIAFDTVVSGPMFFVVGFAIGAAFGTTAGETRGERARAFVLRNPPLVALVAALLAPDALAPDVLVDAAKVLAYAVLRSGSSSSASTSPRRPRRARWPSRPASTRRSARRSSCAWRSPRCSCSGWWR